jgi:hypothetical protein
LSQKECHRKVLMIFMASSFGSADRLRNGSVPRL